MPTYHDPFPPPGLQSGSHAAPLALSAHRGLTTWPMPSPLLQTDDRGLYCAAGDFHIDPWKPVPRAVVTHAHADHARPGSQAYLAATRSERFLRRRIGRDITLQTLDFGASLAIGGVRVSLHPAGHIRGSAQVRVERAGEVWVVTGDCKVRPDPTCSAFEPLACDVLITECTFGLPVYRWPEPAEVAAALNAWWAQNADAGRTSILFAYALGKAQRVLAMLDPSIGPIYTHGAVEQMTDCYREAGVDLPPTTYATGKDPSHDYRGGIVIAPTSAGRSNWIRRFSRPSTGFASGWMMVRGTRRRRAGDRGFVLSDHIDWPALMHIVEQSGASRVLLTHGDTTTVTRWLTAQGIEAQDLETPFARQADDAAETAGSADESSRVASADGASPSGETTPEV